MRLPLVTAALLCLVNLPAQAAGPQPGEYACKEMKGTWLPCTPVHLFLTEGHQWTWGPKRKGSYAVRGRHLKFNGEPHGPVAWGAAHFEGDSIMFVDQKITAVFTRQNPAR